MYRDVWQLNVQFEVKRDCNKSMRRRFISVS